MRYGARLLFAGHACVVALLCSASVVFGSREATTDNRIAALDARTGEVIWIYTPDELNWAHFELHEETLVVYPNYEGSDRSNPFFLDTTNGEPTSEPPSGSTPCATSDTFWPQPPVRLSNGWELFDFEPGNDHALRFIDPATNSIVWTIQTDDYPFNVTAYENIVYWTYSFYSDEAVLYAYRAGESQPAWTFDVNAHVAAPRHLNRPFPHIMDDDLFLGANEHIFELDPRTGQVRHHWDLATLLGLSFEPNFYDGGLNLAVFARDARTMIVSYEARLIALDRSTRDVLWHVHPHTGSTPFPVVHENQVYTTWGSAAVAVAPDSEDELVSETNEQTVAAQQPASPPPPVTRSGHCGCVTEPLRGGGIEAGAMGLVLLYVWRLIRR